jgi:hypothetical protein
MEEELDNARNVAEESSSKLKRLEMQVRIQYAGIISRYYHSHYTLNYS